MQLGERSLKGAFLMRVTLVRLLSKLDHQTFRSRPVCTDDFRDSAQRQVHIAQRANQPTLHDLVGPVIAIPGRGIDGCGTQQALFVVQPQCFRRQLRCR